MNQLAFDLSPPRARRSDPLPSHEAAARAAAFSATHAGRIHVALVGLKQATAEELARATGLSVVQVDRRRKEMVEARLVRIVSQRDGFGVWEAA